MLPPPPQPAGPYSPVVLEGGLAFVSAQPPKTNGRRIATGRIGETVDPLTLRHCIEICAANVLAQLSATPGGLDSFDAVLRSTIYVATDGTSIPEDCNRHASRIFAAAFGPYAVGSGVVCGVERLLGDSPAVIDAIAAYRG